MGLKCLLQKQLKRQHYFSDILENTCHGDSHQSTNVIRLVAYELFSSLLTKTAKKTILQRINNYQLLYNTTKYWLRALFKENELASICICPATNV